MSKKSADESNKRPLAGAAAIAALAYPVAKNLPDMIRYMKISQM